MDTFEAGPLFDSLQNFREDVKEGGLGPNADLVERFARVIPEVRQDFEQATRFLLLYSRKSEATFNRFRNEIERFLIWSWSSPGKSVIQLKRADIENYINLCWSPPPAWINTQVVPRFVLVNGRRSANRDWRPFTFKVPKGQRKMAYERGQDINIDVKQYQIGQSTLLSIFTALNVFFKDLLLEEYAETNLIPITKKRCPYLIKQAGAVEVQRFSELQWNFILETATIMANSDPKFERHLFLIALLKTLYLRISELAIRLSPVTGDPEWIPVMEHFWTKDGYWYLKVFGKGRKASSVTVPDTLLPYIKRYREHLNVFGLPAQGEKMPIIGKIKGKGAMTARQLTRLVQEVFDTAVKRMQDEGFFDEANDLRNATTHWLRHTGASQDIDSRPLKHLADDLRHASMGTTDKIYIQSDLRERSESGKRRKV
ncbi:site-specific recombinase, phage integrase family protein [Oleiphilus messinensis]|uniref:Site-specific recombinase, phage integrase family protein n=2 Tax=Oleiphilus messinensis TaxID=141451 RepID=A0A1Y0I8H7_9GAMM|nr:site-specific recombinase, phage integrase family protein [Oleiphilus messinensis]